MLTRRNLLLGFAATAPALPFLARPAMAGTAPVFSEAGVAIRGADPVAYFRDAAAIVGDPSNALMWEGTMWHFSSAENMEAFEMNPKAYAPQFGGYCSFAMSRGYIATSVPEAWTVHEGKLYLNYSLGVRERWSQDIPGNIAAANEHWPAILDS